MDSDNLTPISSATEPMKSKARKDETLEDRLSKIQRSVHVTFCTLEAASAALEKAENEDDADLWIRAARVVERCVGELKEIRDAIDDIHCREPEVVDNTRVIPPPAVQS
jgi:hypothetical protein